MFGLMTWLAAVGFAYAGEQGRKPSRAKQNEAHLRDMKDVDPITGDWTSKSNGLRYDKHGCLKWRD